MEKERNLQVIALGDTFVGKTTILNKINPNIFLKDNKSCCSEPFIIKRKYGMKNIMISLKFIDTSGQDFSQYNISTQLINESHIFLFVFSDIITFNLLNRRWNEFYKYQIDKNKKRIILIGNKSDLFANKREEILKQGQIFAEDIDAHFITCSANSGDNIDNLERYITTEAKRIIALEE